MTPKSAAPRRPRISKPPIFLGSGAAEGWSAGVSPAAAFLAARVMAKGLWHCTHVAVRPTWPSSPDTGAARRVGTVDTDEHDGTPNPCPSIPVPGRTPRAGRAMLTRSSMASSQRSGFAARSSAPIVTGDERLQQAGDTRGVGGNASAKHHIGVNWLCDRRPTEFFPRCQGNSGLSR